MKIKFTLRFWEYKDSKLATFISMVKGSVGGFFAWIGMFLLPLIIGCGIASQYGAAGTVAIVIGIIAVVSYGFLFLIDEDNIGLKSESSNAPTSTKQNENQAPQEQSKGISEQRLDQITKATTFAAIYIQKLAVADEFLDTREEIIKCLNNDLSVYEMIFKSELYNEANEKTKAILDQQGMKAVAISLHIILSLSDNFPQMRHGEIYSEISKVIYKDIQTESIAMFSMTKQELKSYFVESIKANITNNGGDINGSI